MEQQRTRESKNAMIKALEKSLGVVTTACQNVGIARVTHYDWLREDPDYAEKVAEVENVAIDFAESNLFKQIKSGNSRSTTFYLERKAKHRGYTQKIETDNTHQSQSEREIKEQIEQLNSLLNDKDSNIREET